MNLQARHIRDYIAPLHCNALLPLHPIMGTSSFLCGMYQHDRQNSSDSVDDGAPKSESSGTSSFSSSGSHHKRKRPSAIVETRKGAVGIGNTRSPVAFAEGGSARPLLAELTPLLTEMPGIFDMNWVPAESGLLNSEGHALCLCCTDGTVRFFKAAMVGASCALAEVTRFGPGAADDLMVTSAATFRAAGPLVVTTLHKGVAVLIEACGGSELCRWQAHDYDAWCVAALCEDGGPPLVATGGDDGFLKIWDLRAPLEPPRGERAAPATQQQGKRHDTGVVSVIPFFRNGVVCGTYGGDILQYDFRMLKTVVSVARVGAGAWRLRPISPEWLAVAAMQAGAAVVRCDPQASQLSSDLPIQVGTAGEGTLIYDVCPINILEKTKDVAFSLVTCSFYEKLLSCWEISLNPP